LRRWRNLFRLGPLYNQKRSEQHQSVIGQVANVVYQWWSHGGQGLAYTHPTLANAVLWICTNSRILSGGVTWNKERWRNDIFDYQCRETSKFSRLSIVLQLLEDFVPRSSSGALPLNPAGGLPSPRPLCPLYFQILATPLTSIVGILSNSFKRFDLRDDSNDMLLHRHAVNRLQLMSVALIGSKSLYCKYSTGQKRSSRVRQ